MHAELTSDPRRPTEPPPPPLVLELRGVGVCYRRRRGLLTRRAEGFWAIKDLSLELRRGETLGVIGRNGAGKSTLLRLLAGITRPDIGEYVSYGYQATLLSLQVGFVQHLSGRENVMLSGLLLGLRRREIEARMADIVEFAELEEFIDQPIHTYSSGMRARLGFSTAFYVDPDILLIDEVLGVGDAAFVKKSKEVMRQKISSDTTVVLVSHSASAIRSLCDRAVWIDAGRVRAKGETDEVLTAYEDWIKARSARADAASASRADPDGRVVEQVGPEFGALRRDQRERPRPVYLLPPLEPVDGGAVERAELVLSEGLPRPGLPPFSVSPPLDWREDPEDDRTWRYRLSSWSFLRPILEAFEATGQARYADAARAVALDWIAQVVEGDRGNDFAENRMAIGLRASTLAIVLDDAARRDDVPLREVEALYGEAERLRDRLARPSSLIRYSNHGLFQLGGLLALVGTMPALDDDGRLRRYASESLRDLLGLQFGAEAIHLEHSPTYYLAVVRHLGALLDSNWLDDRGLLTELYRRARRNVTWLTHPDGTLARFGDSDLWRAADLLATRADGRFDDPELEFAVTRGEGGRPPTELRAVFSEAGLAAFRSPWHLPPDRWSLLVATAWFHSRTHKHADDFTFEWSELGRRLIVDSGKYGYYYDDPRRRYVESTRAHNTVEIDGEDFTREPDRAFGSALRAVVEDRYGAHACEAVVERSDLALTHRRLWIYRPGEWLVVADHLAGEVERDLVQWFHFDPSISLTLDGGAARTALDSERELVCRPIPTEDGRAPDPILVRGRSHPRLQGWISLRQREIEPNDALGFRARGSDRWLIALFRLCRADRGQIRRWRAAVVPAGLEVRWRVGGVEEGFDLESSDSTLTLSTCP